VADLNSQQLGDVYRGEDVAILASPASVTDVTGWTLALQVSTYPGRVPVLTLTDGNGITVTNAALGQFTVALTRAQTATPAAGFYFWDLWHTNPGSGERLAGGQILFLDPVYPPP
jgi:hypothetical protein